MIKGKWRTASVSSKSSRQLPFNTLDSRFPIHHSPLTPPDAPIPVHHLPFIRHSPFTINHLPNTSHSLFTIYHSLILASLLILPGLVLHVTAQTASPSASASVPGANPQLPTLFVVG